MTTCMLVLGSTTVLWAPNWNDSYDLNIGLNQYEEGIFEDECFV